jgi:hypothetical protein
VVLHKIWWLVRTSVRITAFLHVASTDSELGANLVASFHIWIMSHDSTMQRGFRGG